MKVYARFKGGPIGGTEQEIGTFHGGRFMVPVQRRATFVRETSAFDLPMMGFDTESYIEERWARKWLAPDTYETVFVWENPTEALRAANDRLRGEIAELRKNAKDEQQLREAVAVIKGLLA